MVYGGAIPDRRHGGPRARGRGFSLIDVLVTMGVVSILVSILIPSLSSAKENANRVVCASNIRQLGIGISTYADDHKGWIPRSVFLSAVNADKSVTEDEEDLTGEMIIVRVAKRTALTPAPGNWDGLGLLFSNEYVYAPKVFYCPSHKGLNPFSKYQPEWTAPAGEIVSNFQYRGEGPDNERRLALIEPTSSALVTDGMRVATDYNHRVGSNVLRADLAVRWQTDEWNILDRLPQSLRVGGGGASGPQNPHDAVRDVWRDLDNVPNRLR